MLGLWVDCGRIVSLEPIGVQGVFGGKARCARVVDRARRYPPAAMRVPRGKTGGTQKVALPEGYLDHLDDDTSPGAEAETADSGG